MRNSVTFLLSLVLLLTCSQLSAQTNALTLQGVLDLYASSGPNGSNGNDGKAFHLVANSDIADLSIFSLDVVSNGGGTLNPGEFTLSGSVSAGDDILVYRANGSETFFSDYFGDCYSEFELTISSGSSWPSHNGDDGSALFENDVLIDSMTYNGAAIMSGAMSGDPYEDSWTYRLDDGSWNFAGEDADQDDGNHSVYTSGAPYPLCPIVSGCTDITAENYNPAAQLDNNSCTYPSDVVLGCTESTAFNFSADANQDDGSCVAVVEGCTDESAFNHVYNANTDDGSCIAVILGCIDSNATNYDSGANTDNSSCEYPGLTNALTLQGVLDLYANSGPNGSNGNDGKAFHLVANSDIADLSIFSLDVVSNGGGTLNPGEFTLSGSVNEGDDILVYRANGSETFFSDYFGDCYSEFELTISSGSSWPTHNGDDGSALFENDVLIDSMTYNGADIMSGAMSGDPYEDSWTYRLDDGSWNFAGEDADQDDGNHSVYSSGAPYPLCPPPVVPGCTDELANNYNLDANEDDGTCTYDPTSATVEFTVDMNGVDQPSSDYDNVVVNGSWNGWNGWGVTLSDEDLDGVWTGSLEVDPGTSFEYVVAVTGPADGYSGWGIQWGQGCSNDNVAVTAGEAGTITASSLTPGCAEILGCLDMNASNFDANATEWAIDEYGNLGCVYASCDDIPEYGCIYANSFGEFSTDFGADLCTTYGGTPCVEISGCTDSSACNFSPEANLNVGCTYAVSGQDCNGNCLNGGVSMSYTPSNYPSENSLTITNCEGDQLAFMLSGTVGIWLVTDEGTGEWDDMTGYIENGDECVSLPDNYTINLVDSYGDGWDIGSLDIDGVSYTTSGANETFSVGEPCPVYGCTDPTASNYNSDADISDDSLCEFQPACDGSLLTVSLIDTWGDSWNGGFLTIDGVQYAQLDSDPASGSGTNEEELFNACVDLNSCISIVYSVGQYYSEHIWSVSDADGNILSSGVGAGEQYTQLIGGCLTACSDETAENYNPDTDISDDSLCEYALVQGCMDASACNYDVSAEQDNGSCSFALGGFDCNGICLYSPVSVSMFDSYGDGWNGNTITFADGQSATLESGSEGTAIFCMDMGACNSFTVGGGTWASEISWTVESVSDGLDVSGAGEGSGSIGNCITACTIETASNFNPYADISDNSLCEYALVQGCMDATACNYDPAVEQDNGSCTFAAEGRDCDGNCLDGLTLLFMNDSYGDGWNGAALGINGIDYTLDFGATSTACVDATGCVLFTWTQGGYDTETAWVLGGDLDVPLAIAQDGQLPDPGTVGECAPPIVPGCTDELANNYNLDANEDDGTCTYDPTTATVEFTVDMNGVDQPSSDYDNVVVNGSWNGWNGWGVTLSDEDLDGVWTGSLEVDPGTSFEYVVAVTGPADGYSGWGIQWGDDCANTNVAVTAGEVGTITSSSLTPGCAEVLGCMDANASNYDASATAQAYDQYGNLGCVYASCDDIPEYGCIYADGFGAFNDEFSADLCTTYGGSPCEEAIPCPALDFTYVNTGSNMTLFIPSSNISDGSTVGVFSSDGICFGAGVTSNGAVQMAVWGSEANENNGAQNGELLSVMAQNESGVYSSNYTFTYTLNAIEVNENVLFEYECNGIALAGCTDETAFNYNPDANIDDASCAPYLEGCMDGHYVEFNALANINNQSECLTWKVEGCLDYGYMEYNPEANFDDGSECIQSWQVLVQDLEGLVDSLQTSLDNVDITSNDDEVYGWGYGDGYGAGYAEGESDCTGSGTVYPIFIDIVYGWNILGYTLPFSQDVAATLADIDENIIIVKNNDALIYWPDFNYNGIGDFIPGQGYQIKTTAAIDQYQWPNVSGERLELTPTVPAWAIEMEVDIHPNDIRSLSKVVNMLGQEVNEADQFSGEVLLYLYNDGTVEKKIVD